MSAFDSAALNDGVIRAMRHVAETIILPRHKQLAKTEIRSKTHPADLVTIADEESERALTATLAALLPGSLVIGEEAVAANPAVMDRLASDKPVWIVDPIDGTSNFVEGLATFAVMIALSHGGQTVMGWIHDPIENRTLHATRGGGTWLTTGLATTTPARVHMPQPAGTDLSKMVAGIYNKDFATLKGNFARVVRVGSAAHDYWSITDGRMQVLCYKRLKPWDHAAGLLIHAEAGGYNRLFSGEEYRPSARDQAGLLCTPTKAIWEEIMRLARI